MDTGTVQSNWRSAPASAAPTQASDRGFHPPIELRLVPTLAGKIVLLGAALFFLFDLAIFGRVGFGGCFLIGWAIVTLFVTRGNLKGIEACARFPREVRLASRFTGDYLVRRARSSTDLMLYTGEGGSRPALTEAVFRLEPGQSCLRKIPGRLQKRGDHHSTVLLVKSTWPGLLFEASARFELPVATLVLPRVQRVREFGWLRELSHQQSRSRLSPRRGDAEFRHLRQYRPGDPTARIHWKSSARQGRTLICELDAEGSQRVAVQFDTRIAHGSTARARTHFENGVTALASLISSFLCRDIRVKLAVDNNILPGELVGRRDLGRALRILARVGPSESGEVAPDERLADGPGRLLFRFGSGDPAVSGDALRHGLRPEGIDRSPAGGLIIDAEQRGMREVFGRRRRAGDHPVLSAGWSEVIS